MFIFRVLLSFDLPPDSVTVRSKACTFKRDSSTVVFSVNFAKFLIDFLQSTSRRLLLNKINESLRGNYFKI